MEMSRQILQNFMDNIRLTEGYILFDRYYYHYRRSAHPDWDVFLIKDGYNTVVVGVLYVTDDGISIYTVKNDLVNVHLVFEKAIYTVKNDLVNVHLVFEKDFSDPDCNPKFIAKFIDKLILDAQT
jgi:hypothetical protein